MLANESHWFCLFSTKRGISGDEPGKYGKQPHLHFISDAFGISKEDFISRFKAGNASSNVHIVLEGYDAVEVKASIK